MNAAINLHELGQSLWLDNITRGMLDDGTIERYRRELAVTGLTSNPSIYQKALGEGTFYDQSIIDKTAAGQKGEDLFFALAIEDLRRAADLFRPDFDASHGVDGWVSLEVSPLLVNDAVATIRVAAQLHQQADRPNLFIRYRARTPACWRSRNRSSPACRSTSRCCFRASSTWPRRRRICAASSAASTPDLIPRSARWRRCSSAAGTWRWPARCPRN